MEAIQQTQAEIQSLFSKKMDDFQAQLQQPSSSSANSTLADDFSAFRKFMMSAIKALQEQINLLAKQADSQEMRSRMKMLLVHGVAEEKGEDLAAITVKLVSTHMKISGFSINDISRCQRIGRSSDTERPRPILLKLREQSLRQKLWLGKTALKGSGITLSEFLTKPRHDAFMAARQRFGITNCWSRDGFVFVLGPDGKRHRITCLAELESIESPTTPAAATTAAALKAKKDMKTSSASSKPKRRVVK